MESKQLGTLVSTTFVIASAEHRNVRAYMTSRIDPIPPEARTDTKLFQMFFVWFSANINVLACVSHVQL